MVRIGGYILGRVNMEGGEFTYGNRIELGSIFASTEKTEYQKLKAAFREVYGYSCRLVPFRRRLAMLNDLAQGLLSWVEKEQRLLKYNPTVNELAADIQGFSKRVGVFSTVKAIAKAYGCDPDVVLNWEYYKVFSILYTDLEEHKYQERYHKVLENEYKHKGNSRTTRR